MHQIAAVHTRLSVRLVPHAGIKYNSNMRESDTTSTPETTRQNFQVVEHLTPDKSPHTKLRVAHPAPAAAHEDVTEDDAVDTTLRLGLLKLVVHQRYCEAHALGEIVPQDGVDVEACEAILVQSFPVMTKRKFRAQATRQLEHRTSQTMLMKTVRSGQQPADRGPLQFTEERGKMKRRFNATGWDEKNNARVPTNREVFFFSSQREAVAKERRTKNEGRSPRTLQRPEAKSRTREQLCCVKCCQNYSSFFCKILGFVFSLRRDLDFPRLVLLDT